MNTQTEQIILNHLQVLSNDFNSLRSEMNHSFEKVNNEAQSFRSEVKKRFDLQDIKLIQHDKLFSEMNKKFTQIDKNFEKIDKRFFQVERRFSLLDEKVSRLERVTHMTGILVEENAKRMEQAGEGIETILETVKRLQANEQDHIHQEVRLAAVESWAKDHQKSHNEGKIQAHSTL